MKRSIDRILTTHAGAGPAPPTSSRPSRRERPAGPLDEAAPAVRFRRAVAKIVRRQVQFGIDVVDDGEMSKPGFIHYVNERLGGFESSPDAPPGSTWAPSREAQAFPEFYEWFGRVRPSPGATAAHLACTGPIT